MKSERGGAAHCPLLTAEVKKKKTGGSDLTLLAELLLR